MLSITLFLDLSLLFEPEELDSFLANCVEYVQELVTLS